MSTQGTRYVVDESDLLHLLDWQELDQDLHLPQCGVCGWVNRCAQDLRLDERDSGGSDLRLCPSLGSGYERCIRLGFADGIHRQHRVMADETRHHERWLRLHPRALRKVN